MVNKSHAQRLANVADLINSIANDDQFDKANEDYLGFINMSDDFWKDSTKNEKYKQMVELYFENPLIVSSLFEYAGLYIEKITMDESIVYDDPMTLGY